MFIDAGLAGVKEPIRKAKALEGLGEQPADQATKRLQITYRGGNT